MTDFQPGARIWLASDDEYPFRLGTVVAPPKSLDPASRRVVGLPRHGVELEPHGEVSDAAEVEGHEVEEERALPGGRDRRELSAPLAETQMGALERLVHGAVTYAYVVPGPNLEALEAPDSEVLKERAKMLTAGSNVAEHDVGRLMRQAVLARPRPLSTWRHESGWEIVGQRTR